VWSFLWFAGSGGPLVCEPGVPVGVGVVTAGLGTGEAVVLCVDDAEEVESDDVESAVYCEIVTFYF
jgi:hypothetical protein